MRFICPCNLTENTRGTNPDYSLAIACLTSLVKFRWRHSSHQLFLLPMTREQCHAMRTLMSDTGILRTNSLSWNRKAHSVSRWWLQIVSWTSLIKTHRSRNCDFLSKVGNDIGTMKLRFPEEVIMRLLPTPQQPVYGTMPIKGKTFGYLCWGQAMANCIGGHFWTNIDLFPLMLRHYF